MGHKKASQEERSKAKLFFFFFLLLLLLLLLKLSSSQQMCRDERQLIARKTPPLQPEFYFKNFVSETHTYNEPQDFASTAPAEQS
jgi:hypothetical protein